MSLMHGDVDLTVNQLYLYDQSVRNWVVSLGKRLQGIEHFNVVFASPERAFATMNDILEKRYKERAKHLKNMPYPYASISRLGGQFGTKRYQGKSTFRSAAITADRATAYLVKWPLPWDMSYQIDFWARTEAIAQAFQLWFQAETTPEGNLLVDLTPVWGPYGKKIIFTESQGVTDNTVLEAEGEQRVVRMTATLTAKAWILMPPEPVRAVHQILVQAFNTINSSAADIDAAPLTFGPMGDLTINEDGWV